MFEKIKAALSRRPADLAPEPAPVVRVRHAPAAPVALPDPLGSSLSEAESLELAARLTELAAPLTAVDTGLLASAISDGDHPALRDEVYVTPEGSLVHGDLTGGAR